MSTGNAQKIAVMGGGGVGKSAITVKFVQDIFIDKYDPTIEDSYRKQVSIAGYPYIAEILDTAGTEQFTAMRDLYIKNAEGILLVFSLISHASLKDMENLKAHIDKIHEVPVPIVICANKCDMTTEVVFEHSDYDEISNKYGGPIYDTSAKSGIGINDAFIALLSKVLDNRKALQGKDGKKKKKKCIVM